MRILRAILPAVALAAAAWSAVLTFGSGVSLQTSWIRLSSRDPVRPLAIAVAAALLFAFIDTRSRTALSEPSRSIRLARWLVLVIAVLVLLAGVRFGTFTAGGSDPSGYVSESTLWRQGELRRPAPAWVAAAPWPDAARTAAPLGYLPGPTSATQVPAYPPGLPLLMAGAHAIAGIDGEYYVVPVSAAVLVWATFLLGVRLVGPAKAGHHDSSAKAGPYDRRPAEAGPYVGLIAAVLMATSPPFLMWLVMPMSDIPAAACWTVALVCALAGTISGAAGAGAAVALAIAIRPNLAPLAAIVAFILTVRASRPLGALILYAGLAGGGVIFVGAVNHVLYGSALSSGYGDLGALYSADFVWPNIRRYGGWFLSTQTVIPLLGLLAPRWATTREQRLVTAAIVIGLPMAMLGLYLTYLPFEEWSYLRFLLPAYPGLLAGLGIVTVEAARRWRTTLVRFGLTAAVAILVLRGLGYSNAATDLAASEPKYRNVASAAAVPANAIFISFQHSGSLRHYTGRDILRWDLMDRAGVEAALDYFGARGYPVYWVGDTVERDSVRQRFEGSRFVTAIESGPRQVIDGVWVVHLRPTS